MFHENQSSSEEESKEVTLSRQRWSIGLLIVFTTVYAGFIGLCAFSYQWFSGLRISGIPAPVWYGLGLIGLALGIAAVYGRVTRFKR